MKNRRQTHSIGQTDIAVALSTLPTLRRPILRLSWIGTRDGWIGARDDVAWTDRRLCDDWWSLGVECWRPVDLALVLDMSGSTEDNHQLALRLSRRLVDRMDVGRQTRVALMSYGDRATTHFHFNTYLTKSHVLSAINIIPSHGRTNTQVGSIAAIVF